MAETTVKGISVPTLRRLPLYYDIIRKLCEEGQETVSANEIAGLLNLTGIQVRKDIAATGIVGKPKIGFNIAELIRTIEQFLGWNKTRQAVVVGVGNLGRALLHYKGFKDLGVDVIAGFDIDTRKFNMVIEEKKILPMERFSNLVQRMKIKIGILAVPASEAQVVADEMVKAGIQAIWNFSPVTLQLPAFVAVQNENLAASLALLVKKFEISESKR